MVISRLLGGTASTLPETVPEPLARLVAAHRVPNAGFDAWALKDRVQAAANELFGPPKFVRFEMPGWS
jgi:hypothetical protein